MVIVAKNSVRIDILDFRNKTPSEMMVDMLSTRKYFVKRSGLRNSARKRFGTYSRLAHCVKTCVWRAAYSTGI